MFERSEFGGTGLKWAPQGTQRSWAPTPAKGLLVTFGPTKVTR